mmetsp:Transcript_23886/g.45405  ORF Transcript_23886/g.45405 Transcript_23886/m.45405 type:complete len:582 (+) Transcript_23886:1331-3076(+)
MDRLIGITQPRRVATVTLAKRVAEEMGTTLGAEIGYSIRFEDRTSPQTVLKFLTDGMLLREALQDPDLKKYRVIMLDEVHERTLHTDVLLGLLKRLQDRRKEDLRIIIMSATLDFGRFQTFFPKAKSVIVQGRQHPVQVLYLKSPEADYLDAALITTMQIHAEEAEGDILVFLTGQEDIENMDQLLKNASPRALAKGGLELMPVPLFAALPPDQQLAAFEPAPKGRRKAILATNIAETSVTIGGVKFVVDPGLAKMRGFNSRICVESLHIAPVSKAQAQQRAGRAGREGPGKCYRLYMERTFNELEIAAPPEIRRCNLATVVLQLKALGVNDVLNFEFMDPPPREAVLRSLELLYALGALDDTGEISNPLGRQLSRFPLEPQAARTIIASAELGCSEEMIVVHALICTESLFCMPKANRNEALIAHDRFTSPDGDHVTLLNMYRGYLETAMRHRKDWAFDNFINIRSLKHAENVHQQLRGHCSAMNIPLKSATNGSESFRRALVSGFFLNVAQRQHDGTYRAIYISQTVCLHPTSVLLKKKPEVIVYNELLYTSKLYIRNVSAIEISWLAELAPRFYTAIG